MKWIFADVDGTIINNESLIKEELIKDVKYAQSKGYEFVIATGNTMSSKMRWLSNELNVRFMIVSNGAGIYDKLNEVYIYESLISHEKMVAIFNLAKKMDVSCDHWDDKNIYISNHLYERKIKHLSNSNNDVKHNIDNVRSTDLDKPIASFKIDIYDTEQKVSDFYNNLISLKLNLHIAIINKNHLEITNNNVNKSTAIDIFLKKYNENIKNCMTIGDSANDYEMLKRSDYSYAMGQSPEKIKKIAKFTTKDVNSNGMGFAIHDYISKHKEK